MSFQAMAWVMDQKVGDSLAKFLLLAIANYINDENECWPATRRLSNDTEMSRTQVLRKLDVLVGAQLLQVIKRKREDGSSTSNLYRLGCGQGGPTVDTPVHEEGVVRSYGPGWSTLGPEPITEPIISPSPEGAGRKNFKARLPKDWKPTPELKAWAARDCPTVEVDFETDKFRDHWASTGEAKLDWDATWRNWIRRSQSDYRSRPARTGGRVSGDELARANRRRINKALLELGGEDAQLLDDDPGTEH